MTFTVTVLNAGTFDATATPPASFVMNALFVPGPAGVVAATAPITYNAGTQTVGIDQSGFLLKSGNLAGLADLPSSRLNLGLGSAAVAASGDFAPIVHTHTASQISDSTTAGRALLTAADAAAQRTSLGLGTMATETAANYALLASPTFTGNPTAPTPATSDNDTSIATTAFVNAYCPAASDTAAGKVELATDAEAQAGTSTTLAVTPAGLREAILDPRYRTQFSAAGWTQVVSGGGSTTSVDLGIAITAGSLSGGYAIRRNGASNTAALSRGRGRGIIDFSKRFEMSFSMLVTSAIVSDQIFRATVGKNTTDNNGDLARAGVGIKLVGPSSLYLQVHNGTTLSNVLSTHTHVASVTYDVRIESDGAGNVTLYVNDTSVATSTGGPTGQTAATANHVQVEGENLAAVTARSAEFSNFQLFLGR